MALLETIKQLYDSEIECGLKTSYDAGLVVWIGNRFNGHRSEEWFTWDRIAEVAPWIDAEARRLYPGSVYARGRAAN